MKLKKIMAVTIAIVFLLGTVATANASFTDIEDNPYKEAIEEMTRLGILEGVGNNLFDPNRELNRAEAAKVAAFLLGYTDEDAESATDWEPMFSDVHKDMSQHRWALGWINLVANDDVIRGVPGGNYLPGNQLQIVEWAAILTRILGHEEAGMSWPDNYNEIAETLGLTDNLDYIGSNVVNRAEMAQMTATAIFDVERPDGERIIDIVNFGIENEDLDQVEEINEDKYNEEDEQYEEEVYENVSMSISVSKALMPAGGGQTTQVTAYVTHNNLPAEGAPVSFFANVESNGDDRSRQLSANEAVTDANGKATVTYTSLAADDNKYISIGANTRDDEDQHGWLDSNRTPILASNNASLVEGRVINPFTGEPISNADIGFDSKHSHQDTYFEKVTDENGYYSVPVLPGEYYIGIDFDLSDKTYYEGSYIGSHHDFRADNTVVLRVNDYIIEENKNYTLKTEMGIMKGVIRNLGSHREVYIGSSHANTVIASVNEDGSFMISLPEGTYFIGDNLGNFLKQNIKVEKGKITDLGTFSR